MPGYFWETGLVYKSNLQSPVKCRLKRPQKLPCVCPSHAFLVGWEVLSNWDGELWYHGLTHITQLMVFWGRTQRIQAGGDTGAAKFWERGISAGTTLVYHLSPKKATWLICDSTTGFVCLFVFFFPIFHYFWNFRVLRSLFLIVRWKSLFPSNATDSQNKKF